jgi:hypothetical protein
MGIVTVPEPMPAEGAERARLQDALESGEILLFPRTPFPIPEEDLRFLIGQRQSVGRHHKNVAYRPSTGRLSGQASNDEAVIRGLRDILGRYARRSSDRLAALLPSYARAWSLDYTTFRPVEESGRTLSKHARNDRLHVDAFPTRPTRGGRILRFFSNVHPVAPRKWKTGAETFEALARRLAVSSGVLRRALRPGPAARVRSLAASLGLPAVRRSRYDEFMHRFHNFLKENEGYQEGAEVLFPEFPAGSSWLVFTDMVSHAVLAGRFALEQTFLVPPSAMASPEKSPIAVLERIAGARMA